MKRLKIPTKTSIRPVMPTVYSTLRTLTGTDFDPSYPPIFAAQVRNKAS